MSCVSEECGGTRTPTPKSGGGAYAYPPPYSPHSTPMLHNIDRLGDLIVMYTGYYRACYVIL